MRLKWLFLAPFVVVAFAAFVALGAEVVKLLWNWLLPPLFGWRTIGFWQALGLLVLCRLLFGGFGMGRGGGSRFASRWTPEERERFRQRVRQRWGFAPPAGGGAETGTSL
jgi:hypothetical protein